MKLLLLAEGRQAAGFICLGYVWFQAWLGQSERENFTLLCAALPKLLEFSLSLGEGKSVFRRLNKDSASGSLMMF